MCPAKPPSSRVPNLHRSSARSTVLGSAWSVQSAKLGSSQGIGSVMSNFTSLKSWHNEVSGIWPLFSGRNCHDQYGVNGRPLASTEFDNTSKSNRLCGGSVATPRYIVIVTYAGPPSKPLLTTVLHWSSVPLS